MCPKLVHTEIIGRFVSKRTISHILCSHWKDFCRGSFFLSSVDWKLRLLHKTLSLGSHVATGKWSYFTSLNSVSPSIKVRITTITGLLWGLHEIIFEKPFPRFWHTYVLCLSRKASPCLEKSKVKISKHSQQAAQRKHRFFVSRKGKNLDQIVIYSSRLEWRV